MIRTLLLIAGEDPGVHPLTSVGKLFKMYVYFRLIKYNAVYNFEEKKNNYIINL